MALPPPWLPTATTTSTGSTATTSRTSTTTPMTTVSAGPALALLQQYHKSYLNHHNNNMNAHGINLNTSNHSPHEMVAALLVAALQQLLQCVDTQWHEIAPHLPLELEPLAEMTSTTTGMSTTGTIITLTDDTKKIQQLAAAVASRVFASLEEPTQALRMALLAGDQGRLLNNNHDNDPSPSHYPHQPQQQQYESQYQQSLVQAALDAYIEHQQQQQQSTTTTTSSTGTTTTTTKQEEEGATMTASSSYDTQQLQALIQRWIHWHTTTMEDRDRNSSISTRTAAAIGIALETRELASLQQILCRSLLLPKHPSSSRTTTNDDSMMMMMDAENNSDDESIPNVTHTDAWRRDVDACKYALRAADFAAQAPTTTTPTTSTATTCSSNSNNSNTVPALRVIAQSLQAHLDHAAMMNKRTNISSSSSASNKTKKNCQEIALAVAYDLVAIYHRLNQPRHVANVLQYLLQLSSSSSSSSSSNNNNNNKGVQMALQIGLDLVDAGQPAFLEALCQHLFTNEVTAEANTANTAESSISTSSTTTTPTPTTPTEDKATADPWAYDQIRRILQGGFAADVALSFLHKHSAADPYLMEMIRRSVTSGGGSSSGGGMGGLVGLGGIGGGSSSSSSSKTSNSIVHVTSVVTHAYLYAGTTHDAFVRAHAFDWLNKAALWAQFTATASLGVMHMRQHATQASTLLEPYLPEPFVPTGSSATATETTAAAAAAAVAAADESGTTSNSSGGGGGGSPFAEGGSLYALGLIHAQPSSGKQARVEACNYLRAQLRRQNGNPNANNANHANHNNINAHNTNTHEALSHGAALGVGLTALGTADPTIVQELKELLDTDSAVAGEAAGMAMGLVLLGTGAGNLTTKKKQQQQQIMMNVEEEDPATTAHNNDPTLALLNDELVFELKHYARETQHEKIIRGIALGLALIQYEQEEHADATIEEMRSDRDPIVRYGAMFALGLAYIGTGSHRAVRILLHTAVSDVSDDVRRAAVLALPFILFRTPQQVPQLVQLLLESFNPQVRYAACVAIGLALAGSGDADSVAMLEPMLDDMVDYVRQGAYLGLALLYMQQSDTCNQRKIRTFRERLSNTVAEKHQSTLTKMGALLATGILDAGGRNCFITLSSRMTGVTKMPAAAGLVLWLQYWHWYPMMNMLSLAFTPTCTIGLNEHFQYPKKFEIVCHGRPSTYAYPKRLEEKKEEKKKRVETVTLSTTAKEKARLARKKAKMGVVNNNKEVEGATSMDVVVDESSAKKTHVVEVRNEKGSGGRVEEVEAMDVDSSDDIEVDMKTSEEAEEEVNAPVTAATTTTSMNTASQSKKKPREPEPTVFKISNPSRITLAQSKVCSFDLGLPQRYIPIRGVNEVPFGIIILNTRSNNESDDDDDAEDDDFGTVRMPYLEPEGEMAPPDPFEWTPPPMTPAPDTNKNSNEAEAPAPAPAPAPESDS